MSFSKHTSEEELQIKSITWCLVGGVVGNQTLLLLFVVLPAGLHNFPRSHSPSSSRNRHTTSSATEAASPFKNGIVARFAEVLPKGRFVSGSVESASTLCASQLDDNLLSPQSNVSPS